MTARTSYCFLIAALVASSALAQPKGFNYDESKVPDFTLPDPLTLENGDRVTDADTWKNKRRAEILCQEPVPIPFPAGQPGAIDMRSLALPLHHPW